jgi:hypothetical protein
MDAQYCTNFHLNPLVPQVFQFQRKLCSDIYTAGIYFLNYE